MTQIPDDTRPKSPFVEPPDEQYPTIYEEEEERLGPGCMVYGFIGAVILLVSIAIVLLAAAAGWTTGQRVSRANATATQNAEIQIQVDRIQEDIANGDTFWLGSRINYLETLGAPQVAEFALTATSVYLTQQPTVTPTSTEEIPATATQAAVEVTATEIVEVPTVDPDADLNTQLANRLETARTYIAVSRWKDAIDELDILISLNDQYETATVRNLMSQSLNAYAKSLYASGELAEAVLYTDWAEEYGPLAEGLSVEREVANNFLSAKALVGTGNYALTLEYLRAAQALASPFYMNGEIQTLLKQEYTAYGDALLMTQPCFAASQYNNALAISAGGTAAAKLPIAQDYCDNGTPTPEGFVPTTEGTEGQSTPAPIGQPGG